MTTKDKINTTAAEFKMITDKKDEPDYKAVSKFVGGMVEVVQFPNGDLLLLNEEGKLMGLPLNPEATALWRAHFTKDRKSFLAFDCIFFSASKTCICLKVLLTSDGSLLISIFCFIKKFLKFFCTILGVHNVFTR